MEILKDKERTRSFIKSFFTIWMTIISLSPYFIVSFALVLINPKLGFMSFDYLFNFISPSILLLIILFVVKKQNPSAGNIKEFIAANSKKVFFSGVILFYLIIILALVIDLDNIGLALLGLVFSFITFPFMFFMFSIGKKFIDKINKVIELNTFSDNSNESAEETYSLGSKNRKVFLKYWSGTKDNIKTKRY